MAKIFTITEIKVAAYNTMARMCEDPDVVKMLWGIEELISDLEEMGEPEPEKVAEAKEKTMEKVEKMESVPKKSRNGPCKIVQPGKFTGPGSSLKRETWNKMMDLRTTDKTVNDLAAMTNGKVTPDEVRAMCGTKKVPYEKWEAMAKALGVAV